MEGLPRTCISCHELKDPSEYKQSKFIIGKCRTCTSKHDILQRKRKFEENGTVTEKVCTACAKTLPAKDFSANRTSADGLQGYCKPCTTAYQSRRKQGIRQKQAEKPKDMGMCKGCSESKPLDQFLKGSSSRCRPCYNKSVRQRLAIDQHTRIRNALRARIWYALKRGKTVLLERGTEKLVGCSVQELKDHLERQFKPGMTWSNWGRLPDQWEIDHIRPCMSFDLSDPEEREMCFNYRNLQPLWMPENKSKSCLWDAEAELI